MNTSIFLFAYWPINLIPIAACLLAVFWWKNKYTGDNKRIRKNIIVSSIIIVTAFFFGVALWIAINYKSMIILV